MEVIGSATKFNEWMFETILPFSKGRILEVGSGLGNISRYFLNNNKDIMLSDLREEYCIALTSKFGNKRNLLGVQQINLINPEFDKAYSDHIGEYNTVFALNVIEHIEEDYLAIQNCKKLLKQNGHLIILVPSYQKLYNKIDQELGHFRRYTQATLSQMFSENGFEVIHQQYFNSMGILGWYFSGRIQKRGIIPSDQMKIYDKLVPAWKVLDNVIQNRVGLSTIVVGRK